MSQTLTEIAEQLRDANKKVQLIYAFNGTGKTRLSRAFKELISPKTEGEEAQASDLAAKKVIYYSAFTEDLFYWKNDLERDVEPRLVIQPNAFTRWVLEEQGQDQSITGTFQHYTSGKLTPHFSADFSSVTFSFERGNDQHEPNIKISKGEESNFIWSVFNALLEQVIAELNIAEVANRSTDVFNNLRYVFVDDPVSSLDENHVIELAVNLAGLIKSSQSTDLKFIIATHNPLFYNVLFNEFNSKACYMLDRQEDGSFTLTEKHGDSNKSFSYHLHLLQTIEQAIADQKVERYHFTLLRNLYEKTASFLGYPKWSELLPDDKQLYYSRIINFTSHSTLSNEAMAVPTPAEQVTVKLLTDHLKSRHAFWQQQGA
ncbi:anticodon nuclease [Acidovorax sp. Leaf76]|uniref:AAA family ATPase n=1 Tax=unclassified Acidovorax TaxID=2684926 RepID=UPI0006FC00A9|nr:MULTISPECIES: AAA family ATPase [unclassified Acidovorax]KQO26676.1 anticodon nuclease [Acidovorax sp. Leaf76]KQO40449.1 anticodon nuclease [Acidovorax sp. Leaf84]KQS42589.1 anticodon nuclease [Acidovorax sp. Leaf191]